MVKNVRVGGGRVVQHHVIYLGEINDSQRAAWCRSIDVVEGSKSGSRQMALFSEESRAFRWHRRVCGGGLTVRCNNRADQAEFSSTYIMVNLKHNETIREGERAQRRTRQTGQDNARLSGLPLESSEN
ncbi:MAG: hypothetical protein OXD42_06020 [Rhodospirillaceae bacterium]|nr:hypothetical protein [Rhodospirillaceae bacterium]